MVRNKKEVGIIILFPAQNFQPLVIWRKYTSPKVSMVGRRQAKGMWLKHYRGSHSLVYQNVRDRHCLGPNVCALFDLCFTVLFNCRCGTWLYRFLIFAPFLIWRTKIEYVIYEILNYIIGLLLANGFVTAEILLWLKKHSIVHVYRYLYFKTSSISYWTVILRDAVRCS